MKRGPEAGQGAGVSLANAQAAWGAELPDWVAILAEMADRASQARAGKEIGYSGSVINAVLKRSYNGDLAAVEKAVRGRFMAMTVNCEVLGEIGAHTCLEHQARAKTFSGSSSLRVQLARACKGACPHSRIGRQPL